MPRLTARFIEENLCCPAQGQLLIRDDELKGFGLRLTKGSMSWILETRVDGQVKRTTLGKYSLMSIEEARAAARKLLSKQAVLPQDKAILRLGEVLEKYLSLRTLSRNTVRNYTRLPQRCLGDWLELPISSITKEMVLTRHRELTKTTKQGSSGETQANQVMTILNSLFRFASHHYEVEGHPVVLSNPVQALSQNRLWHRLGSRRVILPDHKLKDFYRATLALRQKMARDYLLILILTGLRKTEAATLRWEDIDFESKTITVRRENTKNRNEFMLPMTEFVLDIMKRRRQDPRRSEFVFPGREGHLVDVGHCFEKVVEQTGCRFVLHDLRRTYITAAAKIGIPHPIIKRLVNHTCSSDITHSYVVLHVEHLREPMERITRHFLELFGYNEEEWRETVDFHRPGFLRSADTEDSGEPR